MAKSSTSGQGRPKGAPNKATADVKALAQQYTAGAIRGLAALAGLLDDGAGKAESEQARVSAFKELLDRGHGKAMQSMDVTVRRIAELSDAELAAQLAELDQTGIGSPLPSSPSSGTDQTRH
ncbi:MAG TPA: hypothetical protein VNZ47_11800 [Candidatus Dormibacteraeota bacterium]|nr:hypothetical protein [Candidatus Dormibacteraeota bacterium]